MLEDYYNTALSFIGLITIVMQCYVTYLICFYTPEKMRDYKYFLIQLMASFEFDF